MDDELHQLEAELKRLRPVEPRRRVVAAIGGELDRPHANAARRGATRARAWWVWAAVPLAAAAVVALAFAPAMRRAKEARAAEAGAEATLAAGGTLKPIAAENVLFSATDEGLVTLEDGTPARRERLQYVDTITFRNPRTNASLRWTVPREEIRVVPVVFQ